MLGATTVGGAKVAKGTSVGRLGVATFATVGSGGGSSVRVGIKVAVDEAVSAVGVAAIPSVTTAEDGVAAGVEAEGVSDAAGLAGLDVWPVVNWKIWYLRTESVPFTKQF